MHDIEPLMDGVDLVYLVLIGQAEIYLCVERHIHLVIIIHHHFVLLVQLIQLLSQVPILTFILRQSFLHSLIRVIDHLLPFLDLAQELFLFLLHVPFKLSNHSLEASLTTVLK